MSMAIHPLFDGLTFALFGTSLFARVRVRALLFSFFFSDISGEVYQKPQALCVNKANDFFFKFMLAFQNDI
jgi:hypothetical protein